jgi:hypothetical protein
MSHLPQSLLYLKEAARLRSLAESSLVDEARDIYLHTANHYVLLAQQAAVLERDWAIEDSKARAVRDR